VTLIFTPGHTEGTFSLFFPVKDNGKTLTVAYSGGTAFNFVNTVENFQTYINSRRKMAEMAKALGAPS
jgi:metallo-beta-lactamase class B